MSGVPAGPLCPQPCPAGTSSTLWHPCSRCTRPRSRQRAVVVAWDRQLMVAGNSTECIQYPLGKRDQCRFRRPAQTVGHHRLCLGHCCVCMGTGAPGAPLGVSNPLRQSQELDLVLSSLVLPQSPLLSRPGPVQQQHPSCLPLSPCPPPQASPPRGTHSLSALRAVLCQEPPNPTAAGSTGPAEILARSLRAAVGGGIPVPSEG